MAKSKQGKTNQKSAFSYMSIGMQLSATILIGVIGGYKIDQHYNKSPVFLVIGAALGMAAGFYSLLKELLGENIQKRSPEKKDNNKNKWM
jgi:F0F1-type ATP synthase assembly protein I